MPEGQGLSQGHMAGQRQAGAAWGDWAAVGALPTELVFVKFLLSFSYRKVQGPGEGSGKACGKAPTGRAGRNCLLKTIEY